MGTLTTFHFRALEAYSGAITIRPGDILRAEAHELVDVSAYLPVTAELLKGPPTDGTPVRTISAETFPHGALSTLYDPCETVH